MLLYISYLTEFGLSLVSVKEYCCPKSRVGILAIVDIKGEASGTTTLVQGKWNDLTTYPHFGLCTNP